jgi:signal transduction histidine kinase
MPSRKGHSLFWVNQAYAKAVEATTPEEAVSRRMELESSERALATLASREDEVKTKRRYVVVDGERRAVNLIAIPSADGTGGIALDMSAVDDAEQQLERHIDTQQETLDKLHTGVAIFGADTKLVFFNDAYAQLWELDRKWLEERPGEGEILEHLREHRRLPEQADFKSWREARLGLYHELVDSDDFWHLPDGRTLRVITRAHPFGGLIYLYEDVTDQLSLESSYNTLISVQSATLDHLHEAVAVFGSDGRISLVNAAFAETWSLSPTTLKDAPHFRDLTKVCAPQLESDHMADGREWSRIAACITGVSADKELEPGRLHRKDGRILDFSVEPLPDGRTLLTFLDVTDTATIERVLRERNEALETAGRLKSEFISNVSYQLRTPLNSIIGFGEMLDGGLVGELSDRQKEYTSHILQSSGQLRDMVNDILDLAMIEAGTISLDLGEVEIADLLENARQVASTRAGESNISVDVVCPEDIGTITADERRLRQILFNLTSNALRFSEGGGQIEIGAERTQAGVDIWVKDTGMGIPPEAQEAVFERFATLQHDRRGAGLGLALVKSFVELHGGGVTLESEPAKGTRVIFHLPDSAQPAEQAAE